MTIASGPIRILSFDGRGLTIDSRGRLALGPESAAAPFVLSADGVAYRIQSAEGLFWASEGGGLLLIADEGRRDDRCRFYIDPSFAGKERVVIRDAVGQMLVSAPDLHLERQSGMEQPGASFEVKALYKRSETSPDAVLAAQTQILVVVCTALLGGLGWLLKWNIGEVEDKADKLVEKVEQTSNDVTNVQHQLTEVAIVTQSFCRCCDAQPTQAPRSRRETARRVVEEAMEAPATKEHCISIAAAAQADDWIVDIYYKDGQPDGCQLKGSAAFYPELEYNVSTNEHAQALVDTARQIFAGLTNTPFQAAIPVDRVEVWGFADTKGMRKTLYDGPAATCLDPARTTPLKLAVGMSLTTNEQLGCARAANVVEAMKLPGVQDVSRYGQVLSGDNSGLNRVVTVRLIVSQPYGQFGESLPELTN